MPVLRRYSYIINIPYCFSVSIVVFDKNSVGILCNMTKKSFWVLSQDDFFMLSDIYDRKKRLKVPWFTECLQKNLPRRRFFTVGEGNIWVSGALSLSRRQSFRELLFRLLRHRAELLLSHKEKKIFFMNYLKKKPSFWQVLWTKNNEPLQSKW